MNEEMKRKMENWGCERERKLWLYSRLDELHDELLEIFFDKEFITTEQRNVIINLINSERYLVRRGQKEQCALIIP